MPSTRARVVSTGKGAKVAKGSGNPCRYLFSDVTAAISVTSGRISTSSRGKVTCGQLGMS